MLDYRTDTVYIDEVLHGIGPSVRIDRLGSLPKLTFCTKRNINMASFNDYTHQESVVQAVQLSNETYKSVVEALGHELASGLLASFQATWNSSDRCYDIVFRYKDSTTDSSLVTGNYLVQLNTARYVVFDKETFEADYLLSSL